MIDNMYVFLLDKIETIEAKGKIQQKREMKMKEKQEKNEEKTAKIVRREFNFTSFKRSFNLDEKIDTEKIEAKYENGILQVILPKKEVQKPLVKQISIA